MGYSRYDFIREIVAEGAEYIEGNYTPGSIEREDVYDILFVSPVTGNDSGSYSFNAHTSAERFSWEALEILVEACREYGSDVAELLEEGPEACEVTVRCFLLGECIDEILDDLGEFFDDSDDSDDSDA